LEIDFFRLLVENPTLIFFSAIAFGYLVGKVNVRGFEIGATGGVLLVGLLFGHFGMEPQPILGTIGFALFIYSVGLQAGPRFFDILAQDGPRYIALAFVVAATAFAAANALAVVFGFDNGLAAGLLAGALTSTPALVGAQSALEAEGLNGALLESITVGYALSYIFGTLGLLAVIKIVPAWAGIDLAKQAREFAEKRGFTEEGVRPPVSLPLLRGYQIKPGRLAGRKRRELEAFGHGRDIALRIKRGDQIIDVGPDDVMQAGDKVALLAPPERHAEIRKDPRVAYGILDRDLLDSDITSAEIVVASEEAAGRRLGDLRFIREHGCFVTGVRRSQIELPTRDDTILHKADTLTVAGDSRQVARLAERIGVIERDIQKTDFVTFGFGISLGLLLGQIRIKIGALSLGLGSPGGVLLAGILFGFLRSRNPAFARVPPAARFVLMELGMTLFIANIGLQAGGGIVEALGSFGPPMVLSAVAVLAAPLVVGFVVGAFVLRLEPALLVGALTGAMTNTAALAALQQAARSPTPALGYAGAYAFANILMTLSGALMMVL